MPPRSTMFRVQPDLTRRALPVETAPVRPHPTNKLHRVARLHPRSHLLLQMVVESLPLKLVPYPARVNGR